MTNDPSEEAFYVTVPRHGGRPMTHIKDYTKRPCQLEGALWFHTLCNMIILETAADTPDHATCKECIDRFDGSLRSSVDKRVNHPVHYGGDTTYEAIKVIEAWGLGFCLGNTVKYICRAKKKGEPLEDLKKARWYLDREIQRREKGCTESNPKST